MEKSNRKINTNLGWITLLCKYTVNVNIYFLFKARSMHRLRLCDPMLLIFFKGFWPGVKDEYGHIFFHSREWIQENGYRMEEMKYKNPEHGESFKKKILQQHAVIAGFTQALSYAFYQGKNVLCQCKNCVLSNNSCILPLMCTR